MPKKNSPEITEKRNAGREQTIRLQLSIPAHRYLAYYRGDVDTVAARANDGRVVHFPAEVLRPLLSHEGIDGEFLLRIDENDKFVSLTPIE